MSTSSYICYSKVLNSPKRDRRKNTIIRDFNDNNNDRVRFHRRDYIGQKVRMMSL